MSNMTKKAIRSLEHLLTLGLINPADSVELNQVITNFSLAITAQMTALIDKTQAQDPIALQFVPDIKELFITPEERNDPIGDEQHSPVKGIIHRYPDRCLFTPVHLCPIYCRFCFRREKVGTASPTLNPAELAAAYQYIETHPQLWEVILTGGDPFILKPAQLKQIFSRLSNISHVEILRIHTRVPIVDSKRITEEMVAALKCTKPIYIIIHANHAREFTPEAALACSRLTDAGIPLLSQTTLLKNINNDPNVLSELMRCFVKNKIKPYYIHHPDLARGTQHFRVSIAEGQKIMKALRGQLSGLCQPTYVIDIPGGYGKVPIGPNYINAEHNLLEDYLGHYHCYPPTSE